MNTKPIDLLTLIADDKSLVSYRPRWNQITGSMAATILLQQVIYRWMQNGRQPFYKFTRPCDHVLCRPGDAWTEELGMTRHEFETARGRIATRTHGDVAPNAFISYWTTSSHLTWYAINEALLVEQLSTIYPADPAVVGVQLRIPTDEPFPKSGNGVSENRKRQIRKPETPLPESGNGNAKSFPQFGNANAEFQQQIYRDDLIDNSEQRSTKTTATAAPPPAAEPTIAAPAVAAAADPRSDILDWIAFDDALTDKERQILSVPALLAWAYWVKLKQAERSHRVYNPVGLVRAQWRAGKEPRADLLRLARGWLDLDDDGRTRLLGRLEWSAVYAAHDPAAALGDEFPDIPLAAASAVYSAAGGELAPPALMPSVCPADHTPQNRLSTAGDDRSAGQTDHLSGLWKKALVDLEMQMTKATFITWLHGTTASETDDGLTIHCRNDYAVAWLQHRLHSLIQRTVHELAGRPIPIHYEVRQ